MVSHGRSTPQARDVWQPFLTVSRLAGLPQHDRLRQCRRGGSGTSNGGVSWPELVFPNPNGSRLISLLDGALRHVIGQPLFEIDRRPGVEPNRTWLRATAVRSDGSFGASTPCGCPRRCLVMWASASRRRVVRELSPFTCRVALQQRARRLTLSHARDTAMNPRSQCLRARDASASEPPVYPGISTSHRSMPPQRSTANRPVAGAPSGSNRFACQREQLLRTAMASLPAAITLASLPSRASTTRTGCSSSTTASVRAVERRRLTRL
jgi:hypothetical protein